MKILWVKTDFLHPTTRGGQIRTLEMVKRLHARNELHYLTFDDGTNPEGLRRAGEYSSKQYTVAHTVPRRGSLAFAGQVFSGTFSRLPLAVSRYESAEMRRLITQLMRTEKFDCVVCDFLAPAPNFEDLRSCVLFQHNVESVIWERHAQNATDPLRKAYFRLQAKRMFEFERHVCHSVSRIVAVSENDARLMISMFGVDYVAAVPTGVDVGYFTPERRCRRWLTLCLSGQWIGCRIPTAMAYFVREVLPLIHAKRPDVYSRHCGAGTRAGDPGLGGTRREDSRNWHCAGCATVPLGLEGVDRAASNRRRHPA